MADNNKSGALQVVGSLDDTFEALGALMSENTAFWELFSEDTPATAQPSRTAQQQGQQQQLQQQQRQPSEAATIDVLSAMAHCASQLEVSNAKLEVCRLRLQEANAVIKDLEAHLAHNKRLVAAMALRGGAAASGTAATKPLACLMERGQKDLKPLLQQTGQQDVAGLLRQLGAKYPVLVGMGIRTLICNAKVWRTLPQRLELQSVATPQQLHEQPRRAAGAEQWDPPASFARSSTCSQPGAQSAPSSASHQTAAAPAQHSVVGQVQQAQQAQQAGDGWGGHSSRAAQHAAPSRKRLRCQEAQAEPQEALQKQQHIVADSRARLEGFEALHAEPTKGDFVRAIRVLLGQTAAAT